MENLKVPNFETLPCAAVGTARLEACTVCGGSGLCSKIQSHTQPVCTKLVDNCIHVPCSHLPEL
jgi:hypothetical protein